MDLIWEKPQNNGGTIIRGYQIQYYNEKEREEVENKGTINGITATQYQIRNLNQNIEYQFEIRAKNDVGYSELEKIKVNITSIVQNIQVRDSNQTMFVQWE